MSKLFVTDLDGTLFGADSRVSHRSAELLRRLPADKLFTIATARTPATVDLILPKDLGPSIPAIVITGAALWHRAEKRYSDVMVMDRSLARLGEEAILAEGMAPFTYTIDADGGMLYAYTRIPEGRPPFSRLSRAERAFVDERRDLPLKHISEERDPGLRPPLLVFGIGPKVACENASLRVKEKMPEASVSLYGDVFNPDKGFIEVFATGVSKGAAVMKLKERLGASHVTVFGDSGNDAAMLSVADLSVAVANGEASLRNAADIVIGPNTEDSVARFIAHV